MPSNNGHINFIWSLAERLRGPFKQHEYGSIILPLTLLRRLDQVLEPTKQAVLDEAAKYEGRGLNLDPILKQAGGQLFYNASKLSLEKVLADPDHAATHLRQYLAGFDPIVREIFEAFEFDATITRLEKADRLYALLGKFLDPELDLRPEAVPNEVMGDIFEELIRRFSEISNETAGEHFTPREVVRLCAELVLAGEDELLTKPGIVRSVYDPACGTGGMLSVVEEIVRERNPKARLVPFGQELNPESWAICRAEMLVKGQDPSRIAPGSTLSADGAEGQQFDLMLANPPFGVDWADDYDAVTAERDQQGHDGRFGAGTPKKSDGALLFLQNMLAKMKPSGQDGGSRIAIVFNASPLFTGDAGSGESEIRRWLLKPENDWLEAIVALPEQLFYNTGILTYIWILTNRKEERRKGRVQFINARDLWEPMPKSLGNKRRRLSSGQIEEVLRLWREFDAADDERTQVLANVEFGYRQIRVERSLRLRYQIDETVPARLRAQTAVKKLSAEAQDGLVDALNELQGLDTIDRQAAEEKIDQALPTKVSAPVKKAIWKALGVRDSEAPPVCNAKGDLQPDPELRDYEDVPLTEDVAAYLERAVLPYVPDAWVADPEGREGCDFPFDRLFYRYLSPRPLSEIDEDLYRVEERVRRLLAEVSGA